MINILAVGDVAGQCGLDILADKLWGLIKHYNIAFTVVNGENAAGLGITPKQAEALHGAGADVITLGNHTWDRREIIPFLDDCPYIIRPANYAPQVPGRGWGVFDTPYCHVRVISLIGRCNMDFNNDSPFFAADKILASGNCTVTLVDMHAEATSEKLAMAYYLDGRVSVVWGTHTHVQTSDAGVLPLGTGYITDLGMTGPVTSVIGVKPEQSISRFLGNPPIRYETAHGPARIECAIFTIDEKTGRCESAEALRIT